MAPWRCEKVMSGWVAPAWRRAGTLHRLPSASEVISWTSPPLVKSRKVLPDQSFAMRGSLSLSSLVAFVVLSAGEILASARTEVDNKLKNARRELTEYAGQLASERAEQIMRERMTDEDRARIFRDSLREVEEVKG